MRINEEASLKKKFKKYEGKSRNYLLKECKICSRSFLAANEFKMFCSSCRKYNPDYLNYDSYTELKIMV